MNKNKKRLVSLRVGANDLNKVRGVARRLSVRESDVYRFALKVTLGRLGMFHDLAVVGRDLLPVFMELGTELVNHFDLDAEMVERLINDRAQDDNKVDWRDIELVTLAGSQDRYACLRLQQLTQGKNDHAYFPGAIQEYMYEKYMRDERKDVLMERGSVIERV